MIGLCSPAEKDRTWCSAARSSFSLSLSLTHTQSLSLSHTHTHSLSLSLSHTHALSPSLSHTHTHSLSLTQVWEGSPRSGVCWVRESDEREASISAHVTTFSQMTKNALSRSSAPATDKRARWHGHVLIPSWHPTSNQKLYIYPVSALN